jgi:GNAT superfamily N-acetyltransferase
MVRFATFSDKQNISRLWKDTFQDSDSFLDLYFSMLFKPEQSLVVYSDDKLVSSLQLLPYQVVVEGKRLDAVYLFAVMTDKAYRHKGYMKLMLEYAFEYLKSNNVSLVFLIPQEDSLFELYMKFGFQPAFRLSTEEKEIKYLSSSSYFETNIEKAYEFYLSSTRLNNNRIELSFQQFEFVCKMIKDESGSVLAVGTPDEIRGLCFANIQDEVIRIYLLLASNTDIEAELYHALYSKYKVSTVRVSYITPDSPFLGMAKILNSNHLRIEDLDKASLSLMMNE